MPSVNRDSITTSTPEHDACAGPSDVPKSSARAAGSTPEGNEVTPWWPGQAQAVPFDAQPEAGPPCSPLELQLVMQAQRNRENALDALTNSLAPIRAVVSASQGNPGAYSEKLHEFSSFVQKDPSFQKMLMTFPKAEISEALRLLVRDAAPGASVGEVNAIRDRLVSQLDQRVLVGSAQATRKAVVEKLETAASKFEKTAGDLDALTQLAGTLRQLERPSATSAQRAQAAMLRGAVGLSLEASLDPSSVRSALVAQAKLIRHEAERLGSAGETTLYRSLLLHSAVSSPLGAPGSWAAEGPRAVLGRGHSDEQAISNAKLASAVALGVASGGMGLGAGFGMSMAGAFNAPGVINVWKEIDHARAGLSAGTADASAVQAATRKAWVETAEAVISVGAAGYLGAHGGSHGLTEAAADATAKHAITDGAAELVIGTAARRVHHLLEPSAVGTRGDGLQQVRDAN